MRAKRGLKKAKETYHMFVGNPGTGKTTMARMMAGILHEAGVIKRNKVIEVQRTALVGRYIGETGTKTKGAIDRAKGGVIFIDETYRLSSESDKDYGREAAETLMEEMEYGDPVMIFAGYPTEIDTFASINPGFARRVRSTFTFPDYTSAELAEIFLGKVKKEMFDTQVSGDELATLFVEKFASEQRSQLNAGLTDISGDELAILFVEKFASEQRSQLNAGLTDIILNQAKEILDSRLISDSFSVREDVVCSKFSRDDIVEAFCNAKASMWVSLKAVRANPQCSMGCLMNVMQIITQGEEETCKGRREISENQNEASGQEAVQEIH
ncbi:predicted protein [Nematostella vectensis]|uniref:AAA+ ATPase domain-containing protein n=1 Tax=Nematostella vectensis TaxID=45351 RepID=A7RS24_NEMVE|nr:predicted protein [Nematostella vectensis]|eukprot:XP_001637793.1 predicted protein [Nematostella vectensis]